MFISEISDCGRFLFIDTYNKNTRNILKKLRKISENDITQEIRYRKELKIKNQNLKNKKMPKKKYKCNKF